MMNNYRIRKNTTVTDDGHTMRATGEDGLDSMSSEHYDISSHYEVREDWRRKLMSSGSIKRTMSTRKSSDNAKNFRAREMSNTGEVSIHGTTIDTSKASDGEFKNGICVSARKNSKLKSAKRARLIDKLMKLRK